MHSPVYVLFVGFNLEQIQNLLNKSETFEKLIIFDKTDSNRPVFEQLHKQFPNKITLYEGCIPTNINIYLSDVTKTYGINFKIDGDLHLLNSCQLKELDHQQLHDCIVDDNIK